MYNLRGVAYLVYLDALSLMLYSLTFRVGAQSISPKHQEVPRMRTSKQIGETSIH